MLPFWEAAPEGQPVDHTPLGGYSDRQVGWQRWQARHNRDAPVGPSDSTVVRSGQPEDRDLANFLRAVAEACSPQRFREENAVVRFISLS